MKKEVSVKKVGIEYEIRWPVNFSEPRPNKLVMAAALTILGATNIDISRWDNPEMTSYLDQNCTWTSGLTFRSCHPITAGQITKTCKTPLAHAWANVAALEDRVAKLEEYIKFGTKRSFWPWKRS